MLSKLSKIHLLRLKRLLKQARQTINPSAYFKQATEFLEFFKQFTAAASHEFTADLVKLASEMNSYVQYLSATVSAFDQQNWKDAHNGFTHSNADSQNILMDINRLHAEDSDLFAFSQGGREVNLADFLNKIIDEGRTIISEKFQTFFEEIEKAKKQNPNDFTERELGDDEPDEELLTENEQEQAEMAEQLGYGGGMSQDEIETDTHQKIKERHMNRVKRQKADPLKVTRMRFLAERKKNNLNSDMTDAQVMAEYNQYLKLFIQAFRAAKAKWDKIYYNTKIKGLPVYNQKLAQNAIDHQRRKNSYYGISALKMTPEELKILQATSPDEYARVMQRRANMARIKSNDIQMFNVIEREAATYERTKVRTLNHSNKTEVKTKRVMDRNEKKFEDLMKKMRSQF